MTLDTQFLTMFTMIGAGVYVGIAYHTYNRVANFWAGSSISKYVLEIIFWLLQAGILYGILYFVNEGIIRMYIFLAILCGYAMFKALLEQTYDRWLDKLFKIISHIYRIIARCFYFMVIKPIMLIVALITFVVTKLFLLIIYMVKWISKLIYYPIHLLFTLIYKLLPKNVKKYLHHFRQFCSRIIGKD
ncbi:spore cortex biosynthesis protein YabQ [Gracilibacillus sp. YIM 98692]|uniref:spore cortex biosynthesis protein YabQ n=1 Tax=Gracilibacillus sp. YIM 98692 TaxID=2663532 RepID=UPI0013CF6F35|nr:spore cortex biosynthesis protein YabQ [Gracilibacillus sp. YIM 98692]